MPETKSSQAPSVEGLIERLEAAVEGDRILDRAVAYAAGLDFEPVLQGPNQLPGRHEHKGFSYISGGFRWWWDYATWRNEDPLQWTMAFESCADLSLYTTSLDAAMTLLPEGLCEPVIQLDIFPEKTDAGVAWGPVDRRSEDGHAKTAPLAICAALLRVRQSSPPDIGSTPGETSTGGDR